MRKGEKMPFTGNVKQLWAKFKDRGRASQAIIILLVIGFFIGLFGGLPHLYWYFLGEPQLDFTILSASFEVYASGGSKDELVFEVKNTGSKNMAHNFTFQLEPVNFSNGCGEEIKFLNSKKIFELFEYGEKDICITRRLDGVPKLTVGDFRTITYLSFAEEVDDFRNQLRNKGSKCTTQETWRICAAYIGEMDGNCNISYTVSEYCEEFSVDIDYYPTS